jgi:cytochrome c553
MGRSSARLGPTVAMFLAACTLTAGALAQTPAAPAPTSAAADAGTLAGDPKRGKELSYTCLGCHGIDGYRNAYPNYTVPKLEGQHPEYLSAALHGYREGDRSHITMHSQAETLSDQDIADIAVFFAGKPLTTSGKPQGTVPKAAALCTSCHGQDGIAIAPMYPSLAGQHIDYLARAIDEYQTGGRKNPIMKGFAANLSAQDIAAITKYFSSQTPQLRTEPRPYTRFSAAPSP